MPYTESARLSLGTLLLLGMTNLKSQYFGYQPTGCRKIARKPLTNIRFTSYTGD